MDVTADPFIPPIIMLVTAVFGIFLMTVMWMRRAFDSVVPSRRRAHLLAALGCLFGVGDSLHRMDVNPYGVSVYLTWAGFAPMSAVVMYFTAVAIAKFAYALHQNKLRLLRSALRIVMTCKVVVIMSFSYVFVGEVFDWISIGFDGVVIVAALVGAVFSLVTLDMMYHDDWSECALTELEGGAVAE